MTTSKYNTLFYVILTVVVVLLLDQSSKLLVKTNMHLGQSIPVIGSWFYIHFTENYGMAFGIEFGGEIGKFFLSLFRIIAVSLIGYYISFLMKNPEIPKGYILSITLVFAGAVGNIIDSVFYGVIFGYDTYFFGRVVDMLYFPLWEGTLPGWLPFWGGNNFIFFSPVFNVADTAISTGVLMVLLFYRNQLKDL